MKTRNSFDRSSRGIRAAYIAKNRPQPYYCNSSAKFWTEGVLGGVSFGALLIGLFLLVLL